MFVFAITLARLPLANGIRNPSKFCVITRDIPEIFICPIVGISTLSSASSLFYSSVPTISALTSHSLRQIFCSMPLQCNKQVRFLSLRWTLPTSLKMLSHTLRRCRYSWMGIPDIENTLCKVALTLFSSILSHPIDCLQEVNTYFAYLFDLH